MSCIERDRCATVTGRFAASRTRFVSDVTRGLAGLECLSGIPGSVGGTPIQNVGAYGQDVAGTIHEVVAFDRQTGRLAAGRGVRL